jgi:hypothetical protein
MVDAAAGPEDRVLRLKMALRLEMIVTGTWTWNG